MNWLEEVARFSLPSMSLESWIRTAAENASSFVALMPSLARDSSVGDNRGRFGIVAEPSRVELLTEPGLQARWFEPPTRGVKVLALGYEAGYPLVFLPSSVPPGGQPYGVYFECEDGWIIDGQHRRYGSFGAASPPPESLLRPRSLGQMRMVPLDTDEDHIGRIQQARHYISEGEIYQANLARTYQLCGQWSGVDAALALAARNPVAHAAYLRWDKFEIVSNSMETFLTYHPDQRRLCSFPIKGTSGRTPSSLAPDRQVDVQPCAEAATDLRADVKERAEHMMIVDLVRNDLGRVACPGSVKVDVLMGLEQFHGVHHATSMVSATLDPSYTLANAVNALFPGGSITGAPKRRAMSIIRELEAFERGFFTGSIFLLTPDGYLSSSILIRTVLADERGVTLTVGGGITIGSDPQRELAEINHKASIFREVLAGDRGKPVR